MNSNAIISACSSPAPAAAVSLPESQSDYECFVSHIRTDFEMRVETVQRTAEENTKAYEAYCGELKSQLQDSLAANKQLQEYCAKLEQQLAQAQAEGKRLQDELAERRELDQNRLDEVTELLSAMAALSVTNIERLGETVVYTCIVNEGKMRGHKFSLSFYQSEGEYTYRPLTSPVVITETVDLNSTVCFPDYMISRFLANLLDATH